MATTTDTLRLKVGGKYKTRDGRAAEIVQHDPISTPWTFWGDVGTERLSWRPNGSYFSDHFHDLDLVSEIQDEAPAYRYFRYKNPESGFSGQDMRWRVIPGGRPEACDICDGIWRTSAHPDEASLEESPVLVECDADGTPLEPAAPEYRYFRWADEPRTDPYFTVWRFSSADRPIEGKLPNRPGDEWQETSLDLVKDLLSDTNIIECDADGLILGRPEPTSHDDLAIVSFKTTEDLTPEQRTRIAKLAARIVLANGPVFTVDELAGLTVGGLVCKLKTITPAIEL